MLFKHFYILFFVFVSTSILTTSSAQTTDTITQQNTSLKIIDTVKTNVVSQRIIVVETIDSIPKEPFNFIVEKSILNKSLWLQPYRFEDKNLKTLSVKIITKRISSKKESLDFDLFSLINETTKQRIRPSGVYYFKADKKKYLKSKPVNQNYNDFNETIIEGFQNFEARTYKINFLGIKKRNTKASVKSLKKIIVKGNYVTYYLDFPVQKEFTYGKIYYNNKPIGFAAVK